METVLVGYLLVWIAFPIFNNGQIAKHSKRMQSCFTSLEVKWGREVTHAPFAATPIIADLNGDGREDIVAASFDGQIHAVEASTGENLAGSWSYTDPHSSHLTSPLLYDIDGDGVNNVIIVTAQGEITSLTAKGQPLPQYSATLPKLSVKKDWHVNHLSAEQENIHNFISDEELDDPDFVNIDPHILANPQIVDVNRDGIREELIIPISYYTDPDDYSEQGDIVNGLPVDEWNKYLASSVIIFNLTSLKPQKIFHLELSDRIMDFPGYILSSPTLADLDGRGNSLQIIVGTSASRVHVLDLEGKQREGFPLILDSVQSQIAVGDTDGNGDLELIVVDISGNVVAVKPDGESFWEAQISGTSFSSPRITDLTDDQGLEVIVTSNEGSVYVLNGKTGEMISGWPVQISQGQLSPPLLVQMYNRNDVSVVTLSDGHLHLISSNGKCKQTVSVGERSLVNLLAFDLIKDLPGLEILVATDDGALMCLGIVNSKDIVSENEHYEDSLMWTGETRSPNVFTYFYGSHTIQIDHLFSNISSVNDPSFSVKVSIVGDGTKEKVDLDAPYEVFIYIGKHLLKKEVIEMTGDYVIDIDSPVRPIEGHLEVFCINKYGQIAKDSLFVKFHKQWIDDVKYILTFPMIILCSLLLLGFGFQTADLLPTTHQNKMR